MDTTIFIETLTVRGWLLSILPRLVWMRLRRRQWVRRVHVFDGSQAGWTIARACQWLVGTAIEPLQFRLRDLRDEQGRLIRLRITYEDQQDIQREILMDPTTRACLGGLAEEGRFPHYVAKAIAGITVVRHGLWRALLTILVCAWRVRQDNLAGQATLFFMERRLWFRVIERYASRYGVELIPIPRTSSPKMWVRQRLPPQMKRLIHRLQVLGLLGGRRMPARQWSMATKGRERTVRIGVEFYGQLSLDDPGCHSDLFFWRDSPLRAVDLAMIFHVEPYVLDRDTLVQLGQHGIDAVVMRPRLAATSQARIFVPCLWARGRISSLAGGPPSPERRWLRLQRRTYGELRALWAECFAAEGIKAFVSWHRYDETHCAIADGINDIGGVMAIYQRAYESHPSAETAVAADVFFVYSLAMAELERQSGSRVSYVVTTGYLGDCRFRLLREPARRIREVLQQRGARRILAFTDENSLDDERWHTGHSFEREQYAFLLERVLAEPWLGLVCKPKAPASLRRRLGPVAALLDRAVETGRCVVFEQGTARGQGSYPPASAALAADLMIHGHLNAGTAGLESALAGVPTLLLDRLGWPVSPLYRLGVGRVVFSDWATLWNACLEHWRRPGGIPGFGDWSPMLDEFDPFRDGRAAERMGTYLQWLLEGFRAGLDREIVMADAAQRYSARWGKDKIAHVNCTTGMVETVRRPTVDMGAAVGIAG